MDRSSELAAEYAAMRNEGPKKVIVEEVSLRRAIPRIEIEGGTDSTTLRLQQYDRIIGEAREIFESRNRLYGDAISYTGLLGAVVQIVGDYNRLRQMVISRPSHGADRIEEVEDKLKDVLNYCIIGLMMLEDRNFDGLRR